jgi:uncharacterized protein YggE
MALLLILSLLAQTGAGISPTTPIFTINRPILSVTSQGSASTSVKATEYKLILYADTHAEGEDEAREAAESMRKDIVKTVKELGGKEKDVIMTNLNTLEPIEGDPYYRVEQDIQVWLKKVKDISKVKEKFLLLEDVQIGSATPVISETAEFEPAIKKARKDAIKNAKKEAKALAKETGVLLGEPVYITENITYPTYTGYESAEESQIVVTVTIYFEMTYRK